jgi:hypothetical protein
MKKILQLLSAITLSTATMTVSATVYDLNSIAVVDGSACGVSSVTGDNGGSGNCWGAFEGNDPGPGNSLAVNDINYNFISKFDMGDDGATGATSGQGIDWSITGSTEGTWSFDESFLNDIGDFLIVLKAANDPGWAAYSFFGDNNDSFSGGYSISWKTGNGKNTPGLSHIAVYAVDTVNVPEPATLFLFGAGLVGLGLRKRQK